MKHLRFLRGAAAVSLGAVVSKGIGAVYRIALSALLVPIAYHKTVRQLEEDGDDGSGKAIHRESRLFFAMIGAPTLPIGLFWMGWTDYVSIP